MEGLLRLGAGGLPGMGQVRIIDTMFECTKLIILYIKYYILLGIGRLGKPYCCDMIIQM